MRRKAHTIFKRDIADNEQTDGNIVYVVPDSAYVSMEYWDSGYTIVLTKMDGQDTVSYTAVRSNIVSDYSEKNFQQLVDSVKAASIDGKEKNIAGCIQKTVETERIITIMFSNLRGRNGSINQLLPFITKKKAKCAIFFIAVSKKKIM